MLSCATAVMSFPLTTHSKQTRRRSEKYSLTEQQHSAPLQSEAFPAAGFARAEYRYSSHATHKTQWCYLWYLLSITTTIIQLGLVMWPKEWGCLKMSKKNSTKEVKNTTDLQYNTTVQYYKKSQMLGSSSCWVIPPISTNWQEIKKKYHTECIINS